MPDFLAPDGIRLSYRDSGAGTPVLCVPGGPMRDAAYLGDLGGLPTKCRLIVLELRGTGGSERPADLATCRADRLVADVDALRGHLGLDRITVLGHSAGSNIVVRYAETHPDRIERLLLVGPSPFGAGIDVTGDMRQDVMRKRAHEPWFGPAFAAFERIAAGNATPADWDAMAPFFYGTWDDTTDAYHRAGEAAQDDDLAAAFRAEGAFDPAATRKALAGLHSPVLVLAGEFDVNSPPAAMAEFAALFPDAELTVQSGAGHFPWRDDATAFTSAIAEFLTRPVPAGA